MKTINTIFTIAVFAAASIVATAQNYPDEYLGLPGDNLNLYAVMNLFQESETLEGFERSLNDQESMINNLDLNGDNMIDFITVSDYVDGNVHTIVLRTSLNPREEQDIAVFVVDKLRNGEVQIQLIGDEALYGRNYIVEPIYAETPNPGYTGNTYRRNANVVTTTYYDIASWPMIRFIYYPGYRVWRSSWHWGYYPSYWRSWSPHYYHYYYGYHSRWNDHYYSHYRHWDHYRCRSYNTYYHAHVRVYSPTVTVNVNNNRYRNTYSRPDQRRAGEERYVRTASNRTSRSHTSGTVQRTQSRNSAVRSTSTQRSTNSGSAVRSGQSVRSKSPVQSNNSRKTNTSTQARSAQSNSRSAASRTVNRSNSGNSKAETVQRSSSPSRSTSSVSRSSSPSRSSSSATRSSSKSSSPAVQRSVSKSSSAKSTRPSNSRSSSSVSGSRSSSAKSTRPSSRSSSSVSGSSRKSSSPAVKRSSSRSSSAKSTRPTSSRSSSSVSGSRSSKSSVSRSSGSRSSSSRGSSSSSRRR